MLSNISLCSLFFLPILPTHKICNVTNGPLKKQRRDYSGPEGVDYHFSASSPAFSALLRIARAFVLISSRISIHFEASSASFRPACLWPLALSTAIFLSHFSASAVGQGHPVGDDGVSARPPFIIAVAAPIEHPAFYFWLASPVRAKNKSQIVPCFLWQFFFYANPLGHDLPPSTDIP